MKELVWLAPAAGVAALLFALILASGIRKQAPGNERMREITGAIKEGAQAFLRAEYKILVFFVAILFVVIGIGIGNWITAVCFLVGAAFSTMAGYIGMQPQMPTSAQLTAPERAAWEKPSASPIKAEPLWECA